MGFDGFPDDAFEFYEGLRADNSKTFWTAHKHVYETAVRGPFQALLDELSGRFDATPHLFRPYRDVRFSTDKSPYKTAQGGFLEVEPGVGYWMQLDADGVLIGGGYHARDKAQVARYRAAVDDDRAGSELVALVGKLEKAGFDIGGSAVKTRPRGVPADHPRLELIRHENLTASKPADLPIVTAGVAAAWKRLTPLITWLRTHAAP